ncbi:MAG: C25 family cysteine peptidase [Pirellulaceae bacterium]
MSLLLSTALLLIGAEPLADTVVVCPAAFQDTLRPWVQHREMQGHRLAFVSNEQSSTAIRDDIRSVADAGGLRAIVLVGDADPRASTDAALRAITTPTFQAAAKVNVLWGSEPTIATDNWYADLDGDMLPEVSIGRLSADSPEQLASIVHKIIAYETQRPPGVWRRRVNFVAGVGGFGAVADNVIETTTKKVLTEGIPASYETSMTYGSWRSPFCPDPRNFHQATVDRLNEGSLFWVYIGHGQRRFLDQVRTPSGLYHIFDTDDMQKVRCTSGSPIAIFLACYTGSFDEERDCLGEEMLRAPDGPVAALCGSRVTMPYAMSVMGHELMDQYFVARRETLGELVLHAKRQMVRTLKKEERAEKPTRHLLDSIAAVISPARELLDAERREHVLMFNLLGDPLLRLDHPDDIVLTVVEEAAAGSEIRVSGTSQLDGRVTVELIARRDRFKTRFVARPEYDPSDEALAGYTAVYANANDRHWTSASFECQPGVFETTLRIPGEAQGPCSVRVFIEGHEKSGLGAKSLYVKRAITLDQMP